jgi:hypothetical protein
MPRHISATHRALVLAEFRMSTATILWGCAQGYFPPMQLALPAPNPLTVYSRRPLGFMAKPIPEHRRPKGYVLPQNYVRPVDALATYKRFYWS